jgi:hypothetical protein
MAGRAKCEILSLAYQILDNHLKIKILRIYVSF